MRQLSSLYDVFCQQADVEKINNSSADMFECSNNRTFRAAVRSYTTKDKDDLKAGLKQSLCYLIINCVKILKGIYNEEQNSDAAKQLNSFFSLFKMWKKSMFKDASNKLIQTKHSKLQKPSSLPLEEDCKIFKSYILSKMEFFTANPLWMESFIAENFVELRDLACARLTFLNARRGDEPARLLLSQYNEAVGDEYIDIHRLHEFTEKDQDLIKSVKIAYMAGKGTHRVLVIILADTLRALSIISNINIRSQHS
nr:uncharacterized protein LOC124816750 [Hydra vulgaris]